MKKFILAMAAMLAVGSISAQEVMKVEMTNGRGIEIPVDQIGKVHFESTSSGAGADIRELEILKTKIAECNNVLGENFKASKFTNVNKSLERLLALSLFNSDTRAKLHERVKSQIEKNMEKLDTVTNNDDIYSYYGYKYVTTYKFPNVHFTYKTTNNSWDVTDDVNDIQITYTETDGTQTTVSFVPQSDTYVEVAALWSIENGTKATNNIYYRILLCKDYLVKITRGIETIVEGEIHHDVNTNPEIDVYPYAQKSDVNLKIGDYNVVYTMDKTDKESTYKESVKISKGATDFITASCTATSVEVTDTSSDVDMSDINLNLFGKIQLKGSIKSKNQFNANLRSAFASKDSTTIAGYCDAMNKSAELSFYYDGKDTKIGENNLYVGTIGNDYYMMLPQVKFEGQDKYVPFVQELTLKDVGGVFELYKSFNRDVIFGLINLINQFTTAATSE